MFVVTKTIARLSASDPGIRQARQPPLVKRHCPLRHRALAKDPIVIHDEGAEHHERHKQRQGRDAGSPHKDDYDRPTEYGQQSRRRCASVENIEPLNGTAAIRQASRVLIARSVLCV